jgi:hypothetical protein
MLPRNISNLLHPVKYNLGLTLAVYSISCECGQVYIRHTDRSIETRIKQHHWHIQLGYPDKSAVAGCRFHHKHVIKFQDTWIPSTAPGNVDQLIRQKQWNWSSTLSVWNREDGLILRRLWKQVLHLLRVDGPFSSGD